MLCNRASLLRAAGSHGPCRGLVPAFSNALSKFSKMQIELGDGSKISLQQGSKRVLGRGFVCPSSDRTVSRHHLSLELSSNGDRAHFEVIGRNPIWNRCGKNGRIKVFRRLEEGELGEGDSLCVSGTRPVWLKLKKMRDDDEDAMSITDLQENQSTFAMRLLNGDADTDFESIDVSGVDPVKEFGFLVMGHEFGHFRPPHIKKWDWFLEETGKADEDDNGRDSRVKRKSLSGRTKNLREEDDDDEWTGESGDDKEMMEKLKPSSGPKYPLTRSRNQRKTLKNGSKQRSNKMRTVNSKQDMSEDEEDETLGGFIVNDDEDDLAEEESEEEEEEEEEYDDDNDQ